MPAILSRQSAVLWALFLLTAGRTASFVLQTAFRATTKPLLVVSSAHRRSRPPAALFAAAQDSGEDEDDKKSEVNPYADPNYPDLEFVNYSDPEYQVDQGVSDEFDDSTEAQIEAMREERRRRNDEYQFQTYFQKVLGNGDSRFHGEWTVYKTSTFLNEVEDDNETGLPRLVRAGSTPLTVVSRGYKELIETDSEFAVDAERIIHVEEIQQPMGDDAIAAFGIEEEEKKSLQREATEKEIMDNSYWPDLLRAKDFRGHQGIMVCGK